MITKEQAIGLSHGDILHHIKSKNADGSPVRARVSGKVKVWITRPDDFRIPVKYGMYDSFYISKIENAFDAHKNDDNAENWELVT